MQTAGLVLDLYDDPTELRSIFKSLDEVPETIKVAHHLSQQEHDELPDTSFALVLVNDDDRLRKYACIDQGNTELSIVYFYKHGHKLPLEAQKTAAANLATACDWYGLEEAKEHLEKVALLGLLMAPSIIKGTAGQIKDNLAATEAAGGSILTPHQQQHMGAMMKGAELTGSAVMPHQEPADLTQVAARKPGATNASAAKTASPRLDLSPHVKVAGKSAPVRLLTKEAQHYAYDGSYPLDSYLQVKTAGQYFDENLRVMSFEMRREFASNLVKRAGAMAIPLSEEARTYGSQTFAPLEQMKVALDSRRPHLTEKQASVMDKLFEHRAELGPEKYMETLAEFDKQAQIDYLYDQAVLDPALSTFGLQKSAADKNDSWVGGNDYVTKTQISNYAVTAARTLRDDYGDDFVKEFQKDPWGIFSSLPVDQKRRIARAASDNSATGMYDVA